MTITREQLELAARAAELDVRWIDSWNGFYIHVPHELPGVWPRFDPLTDHGQLLDLAMACGMLVDFEQGRVEINYDGICGIDGDFIPGDFPSLAEAVITAAAEQQLAKEMKE